MADDRMSRIEKASLRAIKKQGSRRDIDKTVRQDKRAEREKNILPPTTPEEKRAARSPEARAERKEQEGLDRSLRSAQFGDVPQSEAISSLEEGPVRHQERTPETQGYLLTDSDEYGKGEDPISEDVGTFGEEYNRSMRLYSDKNTLGVPVSSIRRQYQQLAQERGSPITPEEMAEIEGIENAERIQSDRLRKSLGQYYEDADPRSAPSRAAQGSFEGDPEGDPRLTREGDPYRYRQDEDTGDFMVVGVDLSQVNNAEAAKNVLYKMFPTGTETHGYLATRLKGSEERAVGKEFREDTRFGGTRTGGTTGATGTGDGDRIEDGALDTPEDPDAPFEPYALEYLDEMGNLGLDPRPPEAPEGDVSEVPAAGDVEDDVSETSEILETPETGDADDSPPSSFEQMLEEEAEVTRASGGPEVEAARQDEINAFADSMGALGANIRESMARPPEYPGQMRIGDDYDVIRMGRDDPGVQYVPYNWVDAVRNDGSVFRFWEDGRRPELHTGLGSRMPNFVSATPSEKARMVEYYKTTTKPELDRPSPDSQLFSKNKYRSQALEDHIRREAIDDVSPFYKSSTFFTDITPPREKLVRDSSGPPAALFPDQSIDGEFQEQLLEQAGERPKGDFHYLPTEIPPVIRKYYTDKGYPGYSPYAKWNDLPVLSDGSGTLYLELGPNNIKEMPAEDAQRFVDYYRRHVEPHGGPATEAQEWAASMISAPGEKIVRRRGGEMPDPKRTPSPHADALNDPHRKVIDDRYPPNWLTEEQRPSYPRDPEAPLEPHAPERLAPNMFAPVEPEIPVEPETPEAPVETETPETPAPEPTTGFQTRKIDGVTYGVRPKKYDGRQVLTLGDKVFLLVNGRAVEQSPTVAYAIRASEAVGE